MYKGPLHFTVSVYDRLEHLGLFVKLMDAFHELDPSVRLHVCAFSGPNESVDMIREVVSPASCPHDFAMCWEDFGNGWGHNIAAAGVPLDEMLILTAVDVWLPAKFLRIVRNKVRGGESFYRPRLDVIDEDGNKVRGGLGSGWGRGVLACMKSDFMRAGGLRPRTPWSVSKGQQPEDQVLAATLKGLGLKGDNSKLNGFCAFHPRDPENPYYRVLKDTDLSKWPEHVQQSVQAAKEQK